jgi:hypothetical protein
MFGFVDCYQYNYLVGRASAGGENQKSSEDPPNSCSDERNIVARDYYELKDVKEMVQTEIKSSNSRGSV